MLVLSRKEGERITIGDNITLIISKVSGNRVTIGIEAPRDVKVVRSELQTNVADETDCAAAKVASKPKVHATLRDFAAAVLPLQHQVG